MRVATWNLENLFAPGVTDAAPTTLDAYQAKLASLAETIAGIDPDVVAVQEVGPPPVLDDLAAAVSALIGGTWHHEVAAPDDRGIRCGLLSRHVLGDVDQVTDFPAGLGPVKVNDSGRTLTTLGRPGLHATIEDDGRTVHVISVHLKSKLLTFTGGRFSTKDEDERARYAVYAVHRRAAEAAGVRAYATELLDQGGGQVPAVVVAGDLNDDVLAATTQILLGPPGSEIGTGGFEPPDQGDAQRLWNLAPLIPVDDRYSRVYRGRKELIDHILVSHPLSRAVTAVAAGPAPSPSITDNPNTRRDEPGSDHRPVYADFA
ncbi:MULTISPECIES: endonuclease/exonuclease/phosphatase family protein [unclassified Nocardioides]|uniref:endonuclease/exonuclease/phosphatase family protein n=1 Tax=unclassified Nocardioides TaxID=2615069 RepID=UPI003610F51C